MSDQTTTNPAGEVTTIHLRRQDDPPGPPAADVEARQDPDHTQRDFLQDLERATRRVDRQ